MISIDLEYSLHVRRTRRICENLCTCDREFGIQCMAFADSLTAAVDKAYIYTIGRETEADCGMELHQNFLAIELKITSQLYYLTRAYGPTSDPVKPLIAGWRLLDLSTLVQTMYRPWF